MTKSVWWGCASASSEGSHSSKTHRSSTLNNPNNSKSWAATSLSRPNTEWSNPKPHRKSRRGPIGPELAAAAVGESVILEMTIRSVGGTASGSWIYLNSKGNYKDPENVVVSIKHPTPELRKAMGLDRENKEIVGLRVRVTGKVTLYHDAPQIVVERAEQFKVLPTK